MPHFNLLLFALFLNKSPYISCLNVLFLLWGLENSKTHCGLSTWELGTCLFHHVVLPEKGKIQVLQFFWLCSPLIPLPTLKAASLLWHTVKYCAYYVNYFKNLKMFSTINLPVDSKAKPSLSILRTRLILSLFSAIQTMWLSKEKVKIKKYFGVGSGNVDAFSSLAGPVASLNCLWGPQAAEPRTKRTIGIRLLIEMCLFTQASLWIIATKSMHIIHSQVHFRRLVEAVSATCGLNPPSKWEQVWSLAIGSHYVNFTDPLEQIDLCRWSFDLTSFSPNQKCSNYLSVKQSNAVPQTQLFQEIIRSTEEQTICHRNVHRSVIQRITSVTQVFLCWMTHRRKQGLELLKKEPAPWEHERRSRINCVKLTFCLMLIILRKWMEWEQMSAPVMTT